MSVKTKNIPEKTIAEFGKKARALGININLKNLDERINKNTDHMSAFPEIFEFKYKSKKDLYDIMTLLMKLWNSYPRDEFCGKNPDQVFSENGKEASIKQLLSSELMSSLNPNDFSSEKQFRKAVDDFQKKWLDTPRKDMDGITPMEVVLEERKKTGNSSKTLHLSFAREKVKIDDKAIEDFFEDIPGKAKLKNIFKKEEEYIFVLGAIEFVIAQYYLSNPKITDKDVTRALKNFRQDYDKEFDEDSIEWAIKHAALEGLEKHTVNKKISKHEFFLVIDYILEAISNRDWTGDKQAYLKWICNFFGLLKGKEKKEYEDSYQAIGNKFGLSKRQISLIKDPPSELDDDATESKNIVGRNDPCPCGSGKKYKKCCSLKEMEETKDDSFWEEGSFAGTMTGEDANKKMDTLHKGHDEDMNFECKKCNKKISAHNNDWHCGMCDDCFNKHISEIEDE